MSEYFPDFLQGRSDWQNSSLHLKVESRVAHSMSLLLSAMFFFVQVFGGVDGTSDPFEGEGILRRLFALIVSLLVMLSWYFSFGADEPIADLSEAATSDRNFFNTRLGIVIAAFSPNFLAVRIGELVRDIVFKRKVIKGEKDVDV